MFCQGGLNPVATITGASGGTFSAGTGLLLDSLTGEIDLGASIPGNYDVTYTPASSWHQLGQDFTSSNGFGHQHSVSISGNGNRLAIGEYMYDGINIKSGRVLIYEWDGNSWAQIGNHIEGDSYYDRFGSSVQMNYDGTRFVAGSIYNDDGAIDAGQVKVYEWNGNNWTQLGADIDGVSPNEGFGMVVSTNGAGDFIAVTSNPTSLQYGLVKTYRWDGVSWNFNGDKVIYKGSEVSLNFSGTSLGLCNSNGAVEIFDVSNSNWASIGDQIIDTSNIGHSLDLNSSGSRLVIGYQGLVNNTTNGYVKIYEYDGVEWRKIGDSIGGKSLNDRFGSSVSMDGLGNKIVVGALRADSLYNDVGSVSTFILSNGSWVPYSQEIYGSAANDQIGEVVSINSTGNIIAFGSQNSGSVRTFQYNSLCPKPLNITIRPTTIRKYKSTY